MAADGLVAFLRERLAEDEAAARASAGAVWAKVGPHMVAVDAVWISEAKHARGRLGHVGVFEHSQDQAHAVRHDPARVLAEVDAKRRILDLCSGGAQFPDFDGGYESAWEDVLALLAVPYDQHPSYRKEWAP